MPVEILSSEQAWKAATENPRAKYPTPTTDGHRLYPYPSPEVAATFRIAPEAQIFTLGSCFAREVDAVLIDAGFHVTSRSASLSQEMKRRTSDVTIFNKYTIHSILNEVRWALDPAQPYPGQDALVQTGEDKWVDLQLSGSISEGTLAEMLAFRQTYIDSIRNLATADVVILTLGLVESWYDTRANLHLNQTPSPSICKKWPGRFEMRVLDYAEILDALEAFRGLIQQHGKPNVRFLVTVSPIPLRNTFRDMDVLVANAYSKAVQRAAVEVFASRHADVDYFPSFEFVTLGDPNLTWVSNDYRHIYQYVIDRVMSKVMLNYVDDGKSGLEQTSRQISLLVQGGEYAAAITLAESVGEEKLDLISLFNIGRAYTEIGDRDDARRCFKAIVKKARATDLATLNPHELYRVGLTHQQLGNQDEALAVFVEAASRKPVQKNALESGILAANRVGDYAQMKALLAKHEEHFPGAVPFRTKYLNLRPGLFTRGFVDRFLNRFGLGVLFRILRERLSGFLLMLVLVPLALAGYAVIVWVGFFARTERARAGVRALDHFVNASLFDGYAWESISSHAWRKRDRFWGKAVIAVTDFFQKGHCQRANKREQAVVTLVTGKGLHKQTIF